ncbi:MAG: hydrophobe/amphiphile efflux-1 family RND transporter, partial [Phycisphaerae bacterium]|nr:hydrophobe/amphiphile efflux-1 family RND transporter [Phycisphaerae bacterium]
SNYIDIHISDPVLRLPGVGAITIWGERDYSMRVWLDPDKMASLGITTTDVADAIEEQNVQVAAGSIGQPPPVPEGQQFQLVITTLGRLETVEEFEDIIIRAENDGSVVRIKDVARVDLGAESYLTDAYMDGYETVGLGIYALPGANAIDISNQSQALMEQLKEDFPSGMEVQSIYNTTTFVKESIKEVIITLLEAFVLVFIVVFVFLQNFRA